MHNRKSKCQQCGRPDSEVGRISRRGLCLDCGRDNMIANVVAMRDKRGPAYNLWRKRHASGVERYMRALDARNQLP